MMNCAVLIAALAGISLATTLGVLFFRRIEEDDREFFPEPKPVMQNEALDLVEGGATRRQGDPMPACGTAAPGAARALQKRVQHSPVVPVFSPGMRVTTRYQGQELPGEVTDIEDPDSCWVSIQIPGHDRPSLIRRRPDELRLVH